MRYVLDRLGPDNFENMIQSLVRGMAGIEAIIFGDGPDGQREAVIEDADFPVNGARKAYGRTVVQAKYKSPDAKTKDLDWLRTNLKAELDGFRDKTSTHPHIIPQTYLFFTNIVLTPMLDNGVRDKAEAFAAGYKDMIPNILIFGADDIRTMLDNNRDVAQAYAEFLTPGDVLTKMLEQLDGQEKEKLMAFTEYARKMFREDSAVRLEQAGSALTREIKIHNVYTDLEAKPQRGSDNTIDRIAEYVVRLGDEEHRRTVEDCAERGDGFPGFTPHPPAYNLVLIGNAGQGKSTLCQYICQIYRAALLKRLGQREEDVDQYAAEADDPDRPIPTRERLPIKITMKQYAAWINDRKADENHSVLFYILFLVNAAAGTRLSVTDVRALLSDYPWIFLFDGLDEVPASSNRAEVVKQIQDFVEKDLTSVGCDSLVVCTSRPQGYDDAFSPRRYTHFELQELSRPLCERYIEKLLAHLENNGDERERCRRILRGSLDDPMVSKLMTTPLYAAIIVLLVKLGGTPPTKRYALFQEYCSVVVKREQQKEMLPSLHDEYDWIKRLHARLGFLLQTESETAENAAAELPLSRCRDEIERFLQSEGYDGDTAEKAEQMYQAITRRLPFISEVTGAERESCAVFPLRSIQEYFAAEWLIDFDDENKLSEALELISVSAYWRNVYLFVAGYFTKKRKYRNINETLFRICLLNNGDKNHPGPRAEAYQFTLNGSRLALDLLCDNLFSRPDDQRRYLNVVSELLEADCDGTDTLEKLLRLPEKSAELFLREHVIPYAQSPKKLGKTALLYLWSMANRGNEEARDCLEEIAEGLECPSLDTVYNIMRIGGYDRVGVYALNALYRWVTEKYCYDFIISYFQNRNVFNIVAASYLTRTALEELPFPILRGAVYSVLWDVDTLRQNEEVWEDVTLRNELLRRLLTDTALKETLLRTHNGKHGLSFKPLRRDDLKPLLAGYEDAFRSQSMPEVAALVAFLCEPSHEHFARLWKEYRALPEGWNRAFLYVMYRCNWFLRKCAARLLRDGNLDRLLAEYDGAAFGSVLERDAYLAELVEGGDLASITAAESLNDIDYKYEDLPPDELRSVLRAAEGVKLSEEFSRVLYILTEGYNNIPPELQIFCIERFAELFSLNSGAALALKVFLNMPIASLVSSKLQYPSEPFIQWWGFFDEETVSKCMERVDALAVLGGDYLQAYALLPYLLANRDVHLPEASLDAAIRRQSEIEATGNRLALLGSVLCILTRSIPNDEKVRVLNDLSALAPNNTGFWYGVKNLFSVDGKLIVRELLCRRSDREQLQGLITAYTNAIREDLEACPIERDKLTELAKDAHGGL